MWLQIPRVLNVPIAVLLALLFIVIEGYSYAHAKSAMNGLNERLRGLPSVEVLIGSASGQMLSATYGRERCWRGCGALLNDARERLRAGETAAINTRLSLAVHIR